MEGDTRQETIDYLGARLKAKAEAEILGAIERYVDERKEAERREKQAAAMGTLLMLALANTGAELEAVTASPVWMENADCIDDLVMPWSREIVKKGWNGHRMPNS